MVGQKLCWGLEKGTGETMTVLKYPHSERGDRASKVNSIQRKERH